MSTRWMAVQFVGDTLRLPIVNKPDMDKPFGSSELEREVRRIVVNPFSDNPQTFVPEAENDRLREVVSDGEENARLILHESRVLEVENTKLRELLRAAWRCIHTGASCSDCRLIAGGCTLQTAMRELGIEVDA